MKNPMRNREIRRLSLPIVLLLWIIGYTMLWAGSQKQQRNEQQTTAETTLEDDLTAITVMIPEEPENCET